MDDDVSVGRKFAQTVAIFSYEGKTGEFVSGICSMSSLHSKNSTDGKSSYCPRFFRRVSKTRSILSVVPMSCGKTTGEFGLKSTEGDAEVSIWS